MTCFTKTQREILRSFADDYFLGNGYEPYPQIPRPATAAEEEEAIRSHKPKWVELHHRIIQLTRGE